MNIILAGVSGTPKQHCDSDNGYYLFSACWSTTQVMAAVAGILVLVVLLVWAIRKS